MVSMQDSIYVSLARSVEHEQPLRRNALDRSSRQAGLELCRTTPGIEQRPAAVFDFGDRPWLAITGVGKDDVHQAAAGTSTAGIGRDAEPLSQRDRALAQVIAGSDVSENRVRISHGGRETRREDSEKQFVTWFPKALDLYLTGSRRYPGSPRVRERTTPPIDVP